MSSHRPDLFDDGFATTLVARPEDPLALPEERDDEAPAPGVWLDDPAYDPAGGAREAAARPVKPG